MEDVNIDVDKNNIVIVKDPAYYEKLFPLIDQYPKRYDKFILFFKLSFEV